MDDRGLVRLECVTPTLSTKSRQSHFTGSVFRQLEYLPICIKFMLPLALIGLKYAEFSPESWDLRGIFCVARLMLRLAGRR
jgi:hypothetical protein